MSVTWITPVEITPGTPDSWQDVDLSSYIPSGATGVILHIANTTWSTYAMGWRKNGSSDNRIQTNLEKNHLWCSVGVDASRIVELYVDNSTGIDVYLVGYFTTDEVFFTNAIDKSLATEDAWTDIDISGDTGADTAIGAFFEVIGVTNTTGWGLRKNGSSDNRASYSIGWHSAGVIGVDGAEICEGYVYDLTTDFFLAGYCKANTTFLTNATVLSLGTLITWLDLTALPSGATGGYIEATTDSYAHWGGLRKNGSAESIVLGFAYRHAFGMVECDVDRIIEGYIANISVDFFLVAYTQTGEAPPVEWLAGISAGVATVSGIAKVLKEIAGLSAGIATVIGDLTVGLFEFLAGVVSAIATVTGAIKVSRKIASSVTGLSTLNGIVKISKTIKATTLGIATVIGYLSHGWQDWQQKQKSSSSFQMKQKPSTSWTKKGKNEMDWSKK